MLVAQKAVHRSCAFGAAREKEEVAIFQHANLASWNQGSHEPGVHQGDERIVVTGKNKGLLPHQRQEGQARPSDQGELLEEITHPAGRMHKATKLLVQSRLDPCRAPVEATKVLFQIAAICKPAWCRHSCESEEVARNH